MLNFPPSLSNPSFLLLFSVSRLSFYSSSTFSLLPPVDPCMNLKCWGRLGAHKVWGGWGEWDSPAASAFTSEDGSQEPLACPWGKGHLAAGGCPAALPCVGARARGEGGTLTLSSTQESGPLPAPGAGRRACCIEHAPHVPIDGPGELRLELKRYV